MESDDDRECPICGMRLSDPGSYPHAHSDAEVAAAERVSSARAGSAATYRLEGGGFLVVPYGLGVMFHRVQAHTLGDALQLADLLEAQAREIREAVKRVNGAVERLNTEPKERP